ncbi:hypothetical protein RJT34_24783 [Clitoria ternatea]|uniref:Uncharacterized protein n=1 Tax=Clitoria ternatea TaxID=43366 RepID=A0AAN9FRB6_CLITE
MARARRHKLCGERDVDDRRRSDNRWLRMKIAKMRDSVWVDMAMYAGESGALCCMAKRNIAPELGDNETFCQSLHKGVVFSSQC